MWTTLFDISDRVENWNTEESAEIITPDRSNDFVYADLSKLAELSVSPCGFRNCK